MIIKSKKGVTFEFDLNTDERVYLAGDFNNWNPSQTPLKRNGNRLRTTMKLEPGEYQFRYVTESQNWLNDHKADRYTPNCYGTDNSIVIVNEPN